MSKRNQKNSENHFEDFLLKEYDNISAAHFNTNQNITNFFKNFITLIALPLTILAALFNFNFIQNAINKNGENLQTPFMILFILFIVIASVGFCIFVYTINLHFDSILYARTVNAIRKYFFDLNDSIDSTFINNFRVLPQSPHQPSYRDLEFSIPIIFAYCIINCSYLFFALNFFGISIQKISYNFGIIEYGQRDKIIIVSAIILFFLMHILIFAWFSKRRERVYLHTNFIGIDIDGVLNKQNEFFCKFLNEKCGKKLKPQEITSIPVRNLPKKGISASDEITIFNDPNYWCNLPPAENASTILKSIHNEMGFKIFIFTARPWPIIQNKPEIMQSWKARAKKFRRKSKPVIFQRLFSYFKNTFFHKFPLKFFIINFFDVIGDFFPSSKNQWIKIITKEWLDKNKMPFDFLYIEKTNGNVMDPTARIFNRITISRTIPIRYFIEDDLLKAKKLSFICDYFFLFDQPYNQSKVLPKNIIRVKGWDELYYKLKEIW